MLLIETVQGTYKAIPINLITRKPDTAQFFEFWDESALCSFVFAYERNPFAAMFAYHAVKTENLLREAAGLSYD